nr:T9SS type A sorting domain-containing protein [uncultured Allomuricauda sp.]
MRKILLLNLFVFFVFQTAFTQTCDCDVTLNNLSNTNLNLIWASQVNYSPGNTICIPAGTYRGLRFYDFIGTETDPVKIINCGGKVVIDETVYPGISIQRSQYLNIAGTGDSNETYGIEIAHTGSNAVGIYVENLSSDVEINNIEISSAGFAGIMGKTDPYCGNPDTWRSNGYILNNLKIHHNYIHDTGGEGIYLGFTGGYKIESNRNCDGVPIFGHWLENLEVHDNVLENIGWDGIQVNLGRTNCKIYNNHISNYGIENENFQNFAMSIGGGTYEVYNNYIDSSFYGLGHGMQFISAESGTKIYNNVLVRPGFHGIFMHQRHEFEDVNEGFYVANNTIIEPEDSGLLYNTIITVTDDPQKLYQPQGEVPSYFVNNLIVDPGNDYEGSGTWKQNQESYIDFNTRETRDSLLTNIYSNLITRQMDTLGLTDIINNDFSPIGPSSDVVDVGSDVSSFGITYDLNNEPRPSGNGNFDIGAYELQYLAPPPNDPSNRIKLFPNPGTSYFKMIDKRRKRKNKRQKEARITITSMSGLTVYDGNYKLGKKFFVDTYDPGIYVVVIYYPDIIFTKQLIIQ